MLDACVPFLPSDSPKPLRALDIGCGSGYMAAALAVLVRPSGGHVWAIEHVPELVRWAGENLHRDSILRELAESITLLVGDGRLGFPEAAPYDVIHIGASISSTPPEPLIRQLAAHGGLIAPVDGVVRLYTKSNDGSLESTVVIDAPFVPLTDLAIQCPQKN